MTARFDIEAYFERIGCSGPRPARIFHLRLLSNLVASAALDANGHVGRADGMELKIRALLELTPRIGRLLVAENQREEAEDAADGAIDVIGVRTLGEALRAVFCD